MAADKTSIPAEMFEAVQRAREALDVVIPNVASNNLGLAFERIDEVTRKLNTVAQLIHDSDSESAQTYFASYDATSRVLAREN